MPLPQRREVAHAADAMCVQMQPPVRPTAAVPPPVAVPPPSAAHMITCASNMSSVSIRASSRAISPSESDSSQGSSASAAPWTGALFAAIANKVRFYIDSLHSRHSNDLGRGNQVSTWKWIHAYREVSKQCTLKISAASSALLRALSLPGGVRRLRATWQQSEQRRGLGPRHTARVDPHAWPITHPTLLQQASRQPKGPSRVVYRMPCVRGRGWIHLLP